MKRPFSAAFTGASGSQFTVTFSSGHYMQWSRDDTPSWKQRNNYVYTPRGVALYQQVERPLRNSVYGGY
jgi:hypothetical protein